MRYLFLLLFTVGCGPAFVPITLSPPEVVDNITYYPIASAVVNVTSFGSIASLKRSPKYINWILPQAMADVAQGSATVNVVYTNPSVTTFTINTASFGTGMVVSGTDLNMGSISVSGLDDNTLKVCTGAPSSKCNRLYIRVFTLGTASSGAITGVAGFINTAGSYGLDVLAGTVLTPIGYNASPTAATVTNAATIYTYIIANNLNRVRLSNLSIPSIPIKADLSNAGNGGYEMNLVVQYALGYQ